MARRPLDRYPRPNVAVDLAVLTVGPSPRHGADGQSLQVVLQRPTDNAPALPGRFVRERRTVAETVQEVLVDKLAMTPSRVIRPHLLEVFSEPDRDPRGWTMSVAYAVALPYDEVSAAAGELAEVGPDGGLESGEPLDYDHDEILRAAVTELRVAHERRPDPGGLLRPPYTLSRLRHLHEAVLGEPLLKDTFNRRMVDHLEPVLEPDGSPAMHRGVGRPAQLYRPAGDPTGPDGADHDGSDERWRLPRARRR